jgi:hypothetical protein
MAAPPVEMGPVQRLKQAERPDAALDNHPRAETKAAALAQPRRPLPLKGTFGIERRDYITGTHQRFQPADPDHSTGSTATPVFAVVHLSSQNNATTKGNKIR